VPLRKNNAKDGSIIEGGEIRKGTPPFPQKRDETRVLFYGNFGTNEPDCSLWHEQVSVPLSLWLSNHCCQPQNGVNDRMALSFGAPKNNFRLSLGFFVLYGA